MRLVLFDGDKQKVNEVRQLLTKDNQEVKLISDEGKIHACIGCFGCWIKNPGECVIQDEYCHMGEFLAHCDECVIISRCTYGWYSPFIKNLMDRGISYILPDFTKRNGEMHHKLRYHHGFQMKIYFYGDDITDLEKNTAKAMAERNALNLNCSKVQVSFNQTMDEVLEVLA